MLKNRQRNEVLKKHKEKLGKDMYYDEFVNLLVQLIREYREKTQKILFWDVKATQSSKM